MKALDLAAAAVLIACTVVLSLEIRGRESRARISAELAHRIEALERAVSEEKLTGLERAVASLEERAKAAESAPERPESATQGEGTRPRADK